MRSQPGSDEAISSCTRVSVSRAGSTPGKVGGGHAQVLIHIGLHSIIDLCLVIVHVLTPGADDFHLRAAGRDVLAKSRQQQPHRQVARASKNDERDHAVRLRAGG
ncbi:hypothetical protein GCM10009631_01140 [Corynebacterium glaucum]